MLSAILGARKSLGHFVRRWAVQRPRHRDQIRGGGTSGAIGFRLGH